MKNVTLPLAALAATLVVLAWVGPASAHHAIVVKPGQSIQAAIDAASPGDTIVVKRGVYRESVLIAKDEIELVGHGARIEPPAPAVESLCADPAHPDETVGICVFGDIFSDPDNPDYTEDVEVEGFRVSGFDSAIVTVGARDAELEDNRAIDNHAYGFVTVLSPGASIRDNIAARNTVAGIFALDQPEGGLSIAHNRVRRNEIGIQLVGVAGARVVHNRARNNGLDLFWDGFGTDVVFDDNNCRSSDPPGLCD